MLGVDMKRILLIMLFAAPSFSWHTKDMPKRSSECVQKNFTLTEQGLNNAIATISDAHLAKLLSEGLKKYIGQPFSKLLWSIRLTEVYVEVLKKEPTLELKMKDSLHYILLSTIGALLQSRL